jgi:hypothetical protein
MFLSNVFKAPSHFDIYRLSANEFRACWIVYSNKPRLQFCLKNGRRFEKCCHRFEIRYMMRIKTLHLSILKERLWPHHTDVYMLMRSLWSVPWFSYFQSRKLKSANIHRTIGCIRDEWRIVKVLQLISVKTGQKFYCDDRNNGYISVCSVTFSISKSN